MGVSIQAKMIARVHYIARVKFRGPIMHKGVFYQDIPWPPPRDWCLVREVGGVEAYCVDEELDVTANVFERDHYVRMIWRCGSREWVEYIHESELPIKERDLCDHPRHVTFRRMEEKVGS